MAVTFVKGAVIFIGGAVIFIKGVVTSIKRAVTSVREAVTFISKRGLAIKRLFKTARVGVGNIKGVNKHNLKQQLIIYKLKGPLLSIYNLISIFNYSIELSL